MAARKREHLDDYELAEDGSYVYRGTHWRWARPQERTGFLRTAWVLTAAGFACLFGAGCVPLGSGLAVLALIPYGITWLLVAFLVASLWRLTREGEAIRAHVYTASVERLRVLVPLASVASFASTTGALISLALGTLAWKGAVPFGVLMAGAGIFLAQLRHRLTTLTFTKDA